MCRFPALLMKGKCLCVAVGSQHFVCPSERFGSRAMVRESPLSPETVAAFKRHAEVLYLRSGFAGGGISPRDVRDASTISSIIREGRIYHNPSEAFDKSGVPESMCGP